MPAVAHRQGTGCYCRPGTLVATQRLGTVPGPRRARLAPGMAELDARHRTIALVGRSHPGHRRHLVVGIEAGAAMGDAPIRRDAGRLDDADGGTAHGEADMMVVVPVGHPPLDRLVLAHRRDADAVLEGDPALGEGPEQMGRRRVGHRSSFIIQEIGRGGRCAGHEAEHKLAPPAEKSRISPPMARIRRCAA